MSRQETPAVRQELTLDDRRAFMKLPIEERRRRLSEQTDAMLGHYESAGETAEREPWQGGDIGESR